MSKSIAHLYNRCGVPKRASIIKQLSDQIKDRLTVRHMAPLSFYDEFRARHELHLVHTTRSKLARTKLVLRPTDKSGVFHISKASDYERKAATYREQTGAYMELASNPLREIYEKVTHLLGDLKSKKQISVYKQYDRMMPHRQTVHLPYMYFVPKAHKVSMWDSISDSNRSYSSTNLERHSTSTYHEHDQWSNNEHLSISGQAHSTLVQ